jgi:hypothetical protein
MPDRNSPSAIFSSRSFRLQVGKDSQECSTLASAGPHDDQEAGHAAIEEISGKFEQRGKHMPVLSYAADQLHRVTALTQVFGVKNQFRSSTRDA